MSAAWVTVVLVGAGTIAIKAVGPVVLGGRQLHPRFSGLVEALAPAVLSALVATQVLGGEREIVADERVVGLAAAAVSLACRAPILVTLVAAAAATGLVRALS